MKWLNALQIIFNVSLLAMLLCLAISPIWNPTRMAPYNGFRALPASLFAIQCWNGEVPWVSSWLSRRCRPENQHRDSPLPKPGTTTIRCCGRRSAQRHSSER